MIMRHEREANSRERDKPEHRRHDKRRHERGSPGGDLHAEQVEDEDDADAGDCRGHTGGKLVVAERGKRRGLRPVEQDWLFEPWNAIQVRRHEVVAREHLPRRFRESGLVRLPERSVSESRKDGEACDNDEDNEFVRTRGRNRH